MVINAVKQELRGLRRDVSQNFAWYHWALIGVLLLLMVATAPVSAFSGSGAGSAGDPYQITSTTQWAEMANSLGSSYLLMNDLDFTGVSYTPITAFTGTLNGGNKTVSKITIDAASLSNQGLGTFATVSGATFKNLHLNYISITGTTASTYASVGFLFGRGTGSGVNTIDNIYITNSVSTFDGSNFAGGQGNIGALFGKEDGASNSEQRIIVVNCTIGHLTGTDDSKVYQGGLTGYNGYPPSPFTQVFVGVTMHNSGRPIGYNDEAENTIYYDSTANTASKGHDEIGVTAANCANKASFGNWNSATFNIQNGYPVMNAFYVPPPTANFTVANPLSGTVDFDITCTDTSTGTPTSWAWSWGDGTANSTSANPSHTYTSAGTWTITLTATNSIGSSSYTRTNYITTYAQPVLTSVNPTSGYNVNTIPVTIIGTGFRTGDIVRLMDSAHSTVVYAYSTTIVNSTTITSNLPVDGLAIGGWEVTVQDADAVSSNHLDFLLFSNQAPIPDFTADSVLGASPMLVKFTDTTTNNPLSWQWTFGDGASAPNSTTRNPWHTYASSGVYNVTLAATNTYGTGTTTYTNYITVGLAPIASFTHTADNTQIPMTVTFTDTSTQSPTSWQWYITPPGGSPVATTQNLTHTFYTAGTYTISFASANGYGTSSPVGHTVTALPAVTPTPTPTPTPNPSDGHAIGTPDPIEFGDTGTVAWSTANITHATSAVNGLSYTVTAWYVDWIFTNYHDGLLYGSSLFPVALPLNSSGTFDFVDNIPWYPLYNPNSIFTSGVLSGWTSKNYWEVYAYNASAPDPGHYILYSNTSQNVTFTNPTIAATWVGVGINNPAPTDVITLTYDIHSFSGMGSHPTTKLQLEASVDGGTTWTTVSTYPKAINSTGTNAFSVPTARELRYWITAYGLVAGTDISTTKQTLVVQSPAVTPYFKWTDTAGKVISKASDTSTIKFGLSSGTIGENNNYDHLKLQFQKYNDQTDRWDNIATTPGYVESTTGNHVATSDTSNNHAWSNGFILDGSNTVVINTAFTDPVAGDYRALLYGMSGSTATTLLTSATLTVNNNALNPSNLANGMGGWFGIDATGGVARYAAGILICLVIGVIAFYFIRDARVFLVGLAGGAILSFTIGLFDAWILLVLGIIGIVILLFSFGILGTGGGEYRGGQGGQGGAGGSAAPAPESPYEGPRFYEGLSQPERIGYERAQKDMLSAGVNRSNAERLAKANAEKLSKGGGL
jgi:PKD repeat protein